MFKGISTKTYERLGIDPNSPKSEIKRELKKRIKDGSLKNKVIETFLEYNPVDSIKRKIIKNLDDRLREISTVDYTICGSYRRGLPESADIDIVILRKDLSKFIDICREIFDEITEVSGGSDKMTYIVKMPEGKRYMQMDLFLCTKKSLYATILYATGSYEFNIIMRSIAKRKGYLLNQDGLLKDGEMYQYNSEEKYFEVLDMTYKEPEDRNVTFSEKKK